MRLLAMSLLGALVACSAPAVAPVRSGGTDATASEPPATASTAAPPAPGRDLLDRRCEAGQLSDCHRLASLLAKKAEPGEESLRVVLLFEQACAGEVERACEELATFAASRCRTLGDHCARLGLNFGAGFNGFQRRPALALPLVRGSCDEGQAFGCALLSLHYLHGMAVPRNTKRALQLGEDACAAGEGQGCNVAGSVHADGLGVPVDRAKAVVFYERGCDLDDERCCNRMGVALEKGDGIAQDHARAAVYYEAACLGGGYGLACTNLGLAHRFGRGVDVDLGKALRLFARGCDHGHGRGCQEVARAYSQGLGTAKNPALAENALVLGCEADHARCCQLLGYRQRKARPEAALRSFERACELERAEACLTAAHMHRKGLGTVDEAAAKRFDGRAAAIAERRCDRGDQHACAVWGRALVHGAITSPEPQRGLALLERSCGSGTLAACNSLGYILALGHGGIAVDGVRARMLFDQACDGGLGAACDSLGEAHEKGWGAPPNRAKAIERYDQACAMTVSVACDNAARLRAK